IPNAAGDALLGIDSPELWAADGRIVDARRVCEQVTERNGTVGIGGGVGGVACVERGEDGWVGELRDKIRNRLVKHKLSLLEEHHNSEAGAGFGLRSDSENVVRTQLLFRVHVADAEGLQVGDFSVADDEGYRTGDFLLVNVVLYEVVGPLQSLMIKVHIGGTCCNSNVLAVYCGRNCKEKENVRRSQFVFWFRTGFGPPM